MPSSDSNNIGNYLRDLQISNHIPTIFKKIQQIIDKIPPHAESDNKNYRLVKTIIAIVSLAILFINVSISLLPLISISLSIALSLPIIAKLVRIGNIKAIQKTKFILSKQDDRPLLVKNINLDGKIGSIETIYPQLDRENNYRLQWIEETYSLDLIKIPKDTWTNFKIWQEIASLLQKSQDIKQKIAESKILIQKYQDKKKIVVTAALFAKFSEKYEQIISKLESEIDTGKKLCEEIHQLIRDYLIGIEIGEDNSIDAIDTIENSKQQNKEMVLNLQDKYSSLRLELDTYLETIDDYSEFLDLKGN